MAIDPATKSVAYHSARRRPNVRVNGGRCVVTACARGALVEPPADTRPSASAEASADRRRASREGWSPSSGRAVPGSGTEDISHAPDRVQQLLLEGPVDFFAQAAHQHVDDVGLRI